MSNYKADPMSDADYTVARRGDRWERRDGPDAHRWEVDMFTRGGRLFTLGVRAANRRRAIATAERYLPDATFVASRDVDTLPRDSETPRTRVRDDRPTPLCCFSCGESYAEGDHLIADVDEGLCPGCAVGG